jgi:hypothetical protein
MAQKFVNMLVSTIKLLQVATFTEMVSEVRWSIIIQSRQSQNQHPWPYADFHS